MDYLLILLCLLILGIIMCSCNKKNNNIITQLITQPNNQSITQPNNQSINQPNNQNVTNNYNKEEINNVLQKLHENLKQLA